MSEIRAGLNRSVVVAGAELVRTLRDPHVMAYLVAPVALYPLLLWLGLQGASHLVVIGGGEAPQVRVEAPLEVRQALRAEGLVVVRRDEEADLAVLSGGKRGVITVHVDTSHEVARRGLAAVRRAVSALERKATERMVAEAGGAPPRWLDVVEEPVRGSGAVWRDRVATLVALLAVVAMWLSGLYPAIDVVVAEREHRTLEALWMAPVPRWALLVGKVAACTVLVAIVGVAHVVGAGLTLVRLATETAVELPALAPSVRGLWLGVPTWLATAGVVASAHVLVALSARSYKEGELAGTLLVLVGLVPCAGAAVRLLAQQPDGVMFLPLGGSVLVLQQALAGELTVGLALGGAALELLVMGALMGVLVRYGRASRGAWGSGS